MTKVDDIPKRNLAQREMVEKEKRVERKEVSSPSDESSNEAYNGVITHRSHLAVLAEG
jgi:hypothetical protein